MSELCAFCHHPTHEYGPCDAVTTTIRVRWSTRCECSAYPHSKETPFERRHLERRGFMVLRAVTPYYDEQSRT